MAVIVAMECDVFGIEMKKKREKRGDAPVKEKSSKAEEKGSIRIGSANHQDK